MHKYWEIAYDFLVENDCYDGWVKAMIEQDDEHSVYSIVDCFTWTRTKEGGSYWSSIDSRLPSMPAGIRGAFTMSQILKFVQQHETDPMLLAFEKLKPWKH